MDIWAAFKLSVAGIAILTLVIPRQYLANYLGWLAMLVVLFSLYLFHPVHRSDYGTGYLMGLAVLFLAAIAIGLVIALRLAVRALLKRWSGQPATAQVANETAAGPSAMTKVQFVCAGSIAAFEGLLFLRVMVAGESPTWLMHAIAITAVASLWIIPRLLPKPPPHPFMGVLFTAFRWSLLILVAVATAMPILVENKAKVVAAGAPYCIQVADIRGTYKPAGTLLDLSGLTMKGRYQYHALLIVGVGHERRLYNWSYRQHAFVEASSYGKSSRYWPALYCSPEPDFVRRLPLLFAEETEEMYARILGRAYRIPLAYGPEATGGSHPKLELEASAPHFTPNDELIGRDRRARVERSNELVEIWFSPGEYSFNRLDLSERHDKTVVEQSEEFGLTKRAVSGQVSSYPYQYTQYYLRDSNNTVTTLIKCGPTACGHRFLHDGLLFSFSQSRADLADWLEIQQRLIGLLDSFTVQEGTDRAE